MPEIIDLKFFEKECDGPSFAIVQDVYERQKRMLSENDMPVDVIPLSFLLRGKKVSVEAASSVNALEIYQEIFRDNDHGQVAGFVPGPDTKNVVDVGANYGFYSLWVKQYAPNALIYCVEPNPYIYSFLKKNLQTYEKIVFANKALSFCEGEELFDIVRQIPSIAGKTIKMTPRSWLDGDLVETCNVQKITLQEVSEYFRGEQIDILKMDIEGAEGEVLANTSSDLLKYFKRIIIERHSKELREVVFNVLSKAGFKLVYEPDPYCKKHYGNMYFVRNDVTND